MPPILDRAWNRDSDGVAIACSSATPCAFIETSLAPAIAPNTIRAANNVAASVAQDGATSAAESPTVLQIVTRRLPWRATSQPVAGMANIDPTAVPSRVSPNSAWVNPSELCRAGIREIQVDRIRPCSKKRETTAHHAAVSSLWLRCIFDLFPGRLAFWPHWSQRKCSRKLPPHGTFFLDQDPSYLESCRGG